MLNISRTATRRVSRTSISVQNAFRAYTSHIGSSVEPNAPLDLDPSLRALLKDADMSLRTSVRKMKKDASSKEIRELEVLELDQTWDGEQPLREDEQVYERTERKSARATFGSRRIGSVFIPDQMKKSIEKIINGSLLRRLRNIYLILL